MGRDSGQGERLVVSLLSCFAAASTFLLSRYSL